MKNETVKYELLTVIVDFGKGSKVIKIAKNNGISGGTILLGKGTVNNHILKLLDITDVRKEVVFMVSPVDKTKEAFLALDKKFHFEKPNHGIVFTVDVNQVVGQAKIKVVDTTESRGKETIMKNVIFIVVDKGKADQVTESAVLAGARGATILNARGSGAHENEKIFFAFPVEPEKETVLILAKDDITDKIVNQIRNDLKIDEPGKGIIFTIPVKDAYGLY